MRSSRSRKVFRVISDGKAAPQRIAEQIKKAIFEGKIKPGQKLPSEMEFCEMFNTSRVTVRDALLMLKNAGLIYVKRGAGGGTFVAEDLNEDRLTFLLTDFIKWKNISIVDVMQTRKIVEPEIAYMAAINATESDIRNIWEAVDELERFFRTKVRFRASDENFHKTLAEAVKNPLLALFQASIIDILFRFLSTVTWTEEHKKRIIHFHKEIARKVEKKDPEGAKKAMEEHLRDMEDILSSVCKEQQLSLKDA